jgi:hypothetical protein
VLEGTGSFPGRAKRFFSSPQRPLSTMDAEGKSGTAVKLIAHLVLMQRYKKLELYPHTFISNCYQ